MRSYNALWFFVLLVNATAVQKLTAEDFDTYTATHEISLIEFGAPWCSYCQRLAPEFELAANRLESEGLHLASVDCDAEPELCEKNQIPIYPTILLFRGSESLVYNGPRKADAIAAFMRRHREPILTTLTSMSDVANFIVKDNITVVGYFDEDDGASSSIFTTLAKSHRDSYLFGRIPEGVFGQAENVEKPAIVLYKTFDDGKDIYKGLFDLKKIESFLEDSALPLISELGQDSASFQVALSTHHPVAYIFAETAEERASLAAELRPIAEATKGRLVWVTADPIAYAERASRIALRPGQWPAFGIEDRVKGTKFAFSEQGQSERLDRETIQLVVNQFLAGELKSSVKSEPIPSAQPDAVVKVVADTYEQLVTHNGNDVLMLFYSPSCGHCKAMAPSYDRLAQLLQPFTDRLTVAKIDATANDVWPNVDSYPTIKFIASESKDDPIVYSGDRTVHDLIEFVKDKGGKELAKLLPNITEGEDTMALHDEL